MKITTGHPRLPAPVEVIDGPAAFELLTAAEQPSHVSVLHVHFGAGSRTRWHTHPLGQTLVVTEGSGWVQSRGYPPQSIVAGDVVHIRPGEEHWHGAGSDSLLSHLAVQERDNRAETEVLEAVADDAYPTTKESFA